ncbi:MAG: GC-type dockerin domain-anchored protein, partial [Phycisphaerales bacterium]|nr:GC-type dockerin domain-anchored protein [Phycisphaerales bacterium]
VIELLGDFNNDGNFDSADVRYFADGLAMTVGATPVLDRKAVFTAVDNASNNAGGALNFFGTTKATPAPYAAGDSRANIAKAKVAGAFLATPGYAPVGQDNAIDGWDLCYIYKQFKQNANVVDGALNWSNTAEAIGGDLSADMNGDRVIDQNDVVEVVQVVLGTTMGDVNLDGVQNAADVSIVTANMGMTSACWQQGDLDGDGTVTAFDLSIAQSAARCGPADLAQQGGLSGFDGLLDNNDFIVFIDLFFDQNAYADFGQQGGIAGADGTFDNNDFIVFIDRFFAGC